jgi:hypothetical protein
MNPTRSSNDCDVCGQELKWSIQNGTFTCGCAGKVWDRKPPIVGGDEDKATLERHGWYLVETPNDIYWVGPVANAILYLYADGTWFGESAPKRFIRLEEYLEWYAEGLDSIPPS